MIDSIRPDPLEPQFQISTLSGSVKGLESSKKIEVCPVVNDFPKTENRSLPGRNRIFEVENKGDKFGYNRADLEFHADEIR